MTESPGVVTGTALPPSHLSRLGSRSFACDGKMTNPSVPQLLWALRLRYSRCSRYPQGLKRVVLFGGSHERLSQGQLVGVFLEVAADKTLALKLIAPVEDSTGKGVIPG
jgi:hypothetical protein